ncbi:HAMP domain-containing histidine kinase [Nocardia beijingensis]|uniref:sensor histidine kinase n=1 Tax=Nocardia beijingensis TaxID=95162 RepID=UPI001895DF20|nr:HAMP domain-containing sensor histidine kinase [Nocardia beijingensis]MBF6465806.1 HAMP domain-containing histidine kinase [Nocardia beijingensis]
MCAAERCLYAERWNPNAWSLRARVTVAFATIAALMSLVLVVSVFVISRGYLEAQSPGDLHAALDLLRNVLIGCAGVVTLIGAGVGWWASRRVLTPLHQLAGTAARIASGDLGQRLPATGDQDLAITVESFNTMVDSLQRRIEREHRLFGDVSHELRTPLTTLMASVDVLNRHRGDLPERSQRALGLVTAEVDHLRKLLDDLLALARVEAGMHHGDAEPLSVRDLLVHTLGDRRYPGELLTVRQDVTVRGRKVELERAVANLLHNADRHGGGVVAVSVDRDGTDAVLTVDDAGPGVPPADRDRIFERFATARSGRRSPDGTGIGLALVAETVATHGGRVHCTERPGGGARFVVRLPRLGDINP